MNYFYEKIQMKAFIHLLLLLFFTLKITFSEGQEIAYKRNFAARTTADLPFNPELRPFYHGVASGDPLSDKVIIWTRVTPENDEENEVEVQWFMATDVNFKNEVQSGTLTTSQEKDYTVKVDVSNLSPATTYYYYFRVNDRNSLMGRTRTTPVDEVDQLRFAVVSCSNYQAGYFTGYKKIGERRDLDAVIHLGDYIYEYGAGPGTYGYDESRDDRANVPATEILDVVDYRTRYSLYRLDPDLISAHQQHPFIAIWDDHESANDAYTDGAENHGEDGKDEGSWENRKTISKQVYFEWMPIRKEQNYKINRVISYGNLADIINIDTRLEGRNIQINDVTDPALYAPDRTLLGTEQKNWLFDQLKNSEAKWKVIANQVIFSEFHVGWAAQSPQTPEELESVFLDIWDGYPAERDQVIDFIQENAIDNTVILTGDFHSTFAFDVTKRPSAFSPGAPQSITYNPDTGEGSIAVEFATPSITSANFDENIGTAASAGFEFQINRPLPGIDINPNPHMKYADLDQHGYFILNLNPEKAQADWFYIDILDTNAEESLGEHWFTPDRQNRLYQAAAPSSEKQNPPVLAPKEIPDFTLNTPIINTPETILFSLFPNPVLDKGKIITIQYGLTQKGTFSISLFDSSGKEVKKLSENSSKSAGIYLESFSLFDISAGIYFMKFSSGQTDFSKKIIVK